RKPALVVGIIDVFFESANIDLRKLFRKTILEQLLQAVLLVGMQVEQARKIFSEIRRTQHVRNKIAQFAGGEPVVVAVDYERKMHMRAVSQLLNERGTATP